MTEADAYLMKSCRHLVKRCQTIPLGETAGSIAEFVRIHRRALEEMRQMPGRSALILELGQLAKKYPDPREEPLMQEAKTIFNGEWV